VHVPHGSLFAYSHCAVTLRGAVFTAWRSVLATTSATRHRVAEDLFRLIYQHRAKYGGQWHEPREGLPVTVLRILFQINLSDHECPAALNGIGQVTFDILNLNGPCPLPQQLPRFPFPFFPTPSRARNCIPRPEQILCQTTGFGFHTPSRRRDNHVTVCQMHVAGLPLFIRNYYIFGLTAMVNPMINPPRHCPRILQSAATAFSALAAPFVFFVDYQQSCH
jgi:hypothetical protein